MQSRWKTHFVENWPAYIAGAVSGAVLAGVLFVQIKVIDAMLMQVSPYQSVESINRDYKECAKNAPQGFDCVMVPMLVTTDYIKELPSE